MANRVLYIDDITGKSKLGLPPSSFGAVTFGDTATVNLTVDMFDELTADVVISGILDDSITNGVTNKAPSQNAVFDALALKYDASNPASYVDAAGARSAAVADSITDGVTTIAPSQNAVFDALALKRNISLPSFSDEDFDIAAPTSTLSLVADITATTLVDVYINGVLTREGGAKTWTRNHTLNQILFNNALSVNSWVRVRIFT